MPSSDAFARLGLIAAVSVVAGISTLGPLLKQATQSDSRTTGMAATVPPPDGRTTGVTLPPSAEAAGEGAAPPSDRPAPIAARDLAGVVPEAALPPVRTAVARLTIDEAVRMAPPADIAPAAAAAAPAPSAASASAPPAVAAPAFPAVQPLDDGAAPQAAQAAPPQEAQAAAPPQAVQAMAPPQAAKKKRAAAKKKPARPAPFDLRDFFAGRW
jgi:hypothetical protein